MHALTLALRHPDTAEAAARALRGSAGRAEAEGLVELLADPPTARAALAALEALEGCAHPAARDALLAALDSPHSSVRQGAAEALHRRGDLPVLALAQRLAADPSWPVRRAALRALADAPDESRWRVLLAADDPHWRVRHALAGVLLAWGDPAAIERLAGRTHPRVEGLCAYLAWRWAGRPPESFPAPADPAAGCPFWDPDPAVLAVELDHMGPAGRRAALAAFPRLAAHEDERVRSRALDALRRWGRAEHLAEALAVLDEPRAEAHGHLLALLGSFDLDRAAEVARLVLASPDPSAGALAWALGQLGDSLPAAGLAEWIDRPGLPSSARCARARAAGRWNDPRADEHLHRCLAEADPGVQQAALAALNAREAAVAPDALTALLGSESVAVRLEVARAALRCCAPLLERAAGDPDARVRAAVAGRLGDRLAADLHPLVRAAALTPGRAAELVRDPGGETSWHVLFAAARLARVPAGQLLPARPWQPPPAEAVVPPLWDHSRPAPPHARLLGPRRLPVCPVGLSGHYGLPEEGFARAAQAGVNLLFWEPSYLSLTAFAGRLPPSQRNALHFIAGTFEADGARVRRDAERALRALKVEQLRFFLLFWVRSWRRASEDVRGALEALVREGKVDSFGLSTHDRGLAVEALEAGWDPVMVRHSAAHRGAEGRVLPLATARGVGLIAFNSTCYGRLLPALPAADCYRFTLAQPAIAACLSAPATLEQLDDTLAVVRDPGLPPDRRARAEQAGATLYAEETVFRRLVRSL